MTSLTRSIASGELPLTAFVAGVTKACLTAIVPRCIVVKLNFAKKISLAVAGVAAATATLAVGIMNPLAIRAQSPQMVERSVTPKFEVASIKPSTDCGNIGRGGRGGAAAALSPERLDLKCRTVMDLIQSAYVQFANGKQGLPGGQEVPISGGPAWISSDRYDIEAKAESPQSSELMRGPMIQALLEDRFKLKIHRDSKEIPTYALTLAKGVPKLQIAQEGKCIPRGLARSPEQRQAGLLTCGVFAPSGTNDGPYMYSTTLANFCAQLSLVLDRPVVDKTGIAGVFDIHVEVESPSSEPSPAAASDGMAGGPRGRLSPTDSLGSAIFRAVQKVGLKLEPAKGPGEFLVIDHVERPSEN